MRAGNRTLFRELQINTPYESLKDIFCLRFNRRTDAYHKIRFNNIEFKLISVPVREDIKIKDSIK